MQVLDLSGIVDAIANCEVCTWRELDIMHEL